MDRFPPGVLTNKGAGPFFDRERSASLAPSGLGQGVQ